LTYSKKALAHGRNFKAYLFQQLQALLSANREALYPDQNSTTSPIARMPSDPGTMRWMQQPASLKTAIRFLRCPKRAEPDTPRRGGMRKTLQPDDGGRRFFWAAALQPQNALVSRQLPAGLNRPQRPLRRRRIKRMRRRPAEASRSNPAFDPGCDPGQKSQDGRRQQPRPTGEGFIPALCSFSAHST
jgi:hypothetical protein